MASSRQTRAPTSRRKGLGAGAVWRLAEPEREEEALLPLPVVRLPPEVRFPLEERLPLAALLPPEAVRLPPELFFLVAMALQFLSSGG